MSSEHTQQEALVLAFARGTSPSKWAHRWKESFRNQRLVLVPLPLRSAESLPESATIAVDNQETVPDILLQRFGPLTRPHNASGDSPTHHAVRLYDEDVALAVSSDHELATVPAVSAEELELVTLIDHPDHLSEWPAVTPPADHRYAATDAKQAVETVATGAGCALLPMPLARQLGRKDVALLTVDDLPKTSIWAVWRRDRDADDIQNLIGVLRGRKSTSSRSLQTGRSRE